MNSIELLLSKVSRIKRGRLKDPTGKVPKIFYCHVPKCAGIAVSNQIWKQVFDGYQVSTFNFDLKASDTASKTLAVDRMTVREFVFVYNLSIPQNYYGTGHVRCRPNIVRAFKDEWNFLTILRNPVQRWISEYVYNTYKEGDWEKNILPIEEYLSTEKARVTGLSYLRYFSNMPEGYFGDYRKFIEEAVETLEHFSVIGITEAIDEWCESFERCFHKSISIPPRNTSPQMEETARIQANASLMTKIEKLCEPDIDVYRQIVEKLNRQKSAILDN